MENDKKIVAIYARVSTGRQEQEATIESQLDEVKRKIIEDGHILPDENIFIDDGWSGELIARPDLDRMRDFALTGKFSALYVYSSILLFILSILTFSNNIILSWSILNI